MSILKDRVVLSNAEAYGASRNLEFGCSLHFQPNGEGLSLESFLKKLCLLNSRTLWGKKAQQTKIMAITPSLALWDKFCMLEPRLNRMNLTGKRGAGKRTDGLNAPIHFRGADRPAWVPTGAESILI